MRKTTKMYTTYFIVEGASPFPMDMLRYDSAIPATENEAGVLDRINAPYVDAGTVRVALRSVKVNTSGPTEGRWESHGWKVVTDGPAQRQLEEIVRRTF